MNPSAWLAALARGERRLAGLDEVPSRAGNRLPALLLAGAMLVVVVLVFLMEFPPVWESLHDTIALLDAGWRLQHGQIPHRDFYSVIGPFPLAVLSAAARWPGGIVTGLPKVLLLCGLLAAACGWFATRDRLGVWWRLLFAGMLLLLPLTPSFLGAGDGPPFGSLHHTTYGMIYNRLAWTAFLLQMLFMLLPREWPAGDRSGTFREAVGVGSAAGLCIFSKINFLIAALALTAYWLVANRDRRGLRLAGWLAGLGAVGLLFTVHPGGVIEFFGDQWRLLHVNRAEESHLASLAMRLGKNLPWMLLLPALHAWLLASFAAVSGRALPPRMMSDFAAAWATSLFITTFNLEGGQLPGLVVVGLITVASAHRLLGAAEAPPGIAAKLVVVKSSVFLLVASYLCFELCSLGYATLWRLRKPTWSEESERLPGQLSPIPIPVFFNEPSGHAAVEAAILRRRNQAWANPGTDPYITSRQLARWINDGAELLAGRVGPADRIFVADWLNPFNLALELPPAKGGAVLWDYRRMVDERVHPDAERTLAEVTIFMVPKRSIWTGQREFMLATYGRGLGSDFVREAESPLWTCWRRVPRK